MKREEAIVILDGFKHNPLFNEQHFEALDMAISALSENKGEWIESKERSGHWYCSVCGGIHTDPETGKWREIFDYKYPFCPNCGADMRKAEKPETCKGCLEPCIMYEPDMRACKKKVTERGEE